MATEKGSVAGRLTLSQMHEWGEPMHSFAPMNAQAVELQRLAAKLNENGITTAWADEDGAIVTLVFDGPNGETWEAVYVAGTVDIWRQVKQNWLIPGKVYESSKPVSLGEFNVDQAARFIVSAVAA